MIVIFVPPSIPIDHLESTPQSVAAFRCSKYAEYYIRAMTSEVEGRAANGTFSDEDIPQ